MGSAQRGISPKQYDGSEMIEKLNSKNFSENLNSEFKLLTVNAQPLPLRLTEVTERNGGPKVEQFSLFFVGPKTPLLQQGIYRLQHEKLGEFDLFLVPLGMDNDGVRYECAFNRFRQQETSNA